MITGCLLGGLHLQQPVLVDLGLDVVDQPQDVLDDWVLVLLNVLVHLRDLLDGVGVDLGSDSFTRSHVLQGERDNPVQKWFLRNGMTFT